MADALIQTRALSKSYRHVRALDEVSIDIERGEFVAVMGPSGSGKSTLMNLLGCLDRASSGSYRFAGVDVAYLDDDALAALRNRQFGFVFQSPNLLGRASALENVELPLLYAKVPRKMRRARARNLLDAVGLDGRMGHTPAELSAGQQQRVAIARALAARPALMLADEPTGALDSRTGGEIMDLLAQLNRSGLTIVMVTHDEAIARRADRILRFKDGRLVQTCSGGERERHQPIKMAMGGRP
jgi:putative ABC transport system ATP-binding protein